MDKNLINLSILCGAYAVAELQSKKKIKKSRSTRTNPYLADRKSKGRCVKDGSHSLLLMTASDGAYKFSYLDIGAYGSEGDANVFSQSKFGQDVLQDAIDFPEDGTITHSATLNSKYDQTAIQTVKEKIQPFDLREQVDRDSNPSSSGISYINERRQRHKGNRKLNLRSNFEFYPKDSKEACRSFANDKLDEPTFIHHSFVAELPDVVHMERALLVLLDDFGSGKLKAFGGNNTLEQMTKIREQQENLAKMHFEMAATDEDPPYECKNDESISKAQTKMAILLKKLEELSTSLETLQSSHTVEIDRN